MRFVGRTVQLIVALGWTLVVVVPFLSLVLLSFRSQVGIYLHPLGLTGQLYPSNFSTAWDGPPGGEPLYRFMLNSVVAAAVCLIIGLGAGAPAAYQISRLNARGRQRWRTVFLLGALVPIVVLVLPLFIAADELNLVDSTLVLGILYGALSIPAIVLILEAFFEGFPMELTDAARIDGLSGSMAFVRLVLPLSRAALIAVSMLVLVFVWSEAQLGVAFLGTPASRTVAVGMLGFVSMYQSNTPAIFAGLTIAMIPVMALYFIFHKQTMTSVTIGGTIR